MHYRRLFLLDAVQFRPTKGTDFAIETSCPCPDCLAEAMAPEGPHTPSVPSYGIDGPTPVPVPVEALFDEDGEETDWLDDAHALVAHAGESVWLSLEIDEADPWANLVEVSVQ